MYQHEREAALFTQAYNFVSDHWREFLAVLIPVAVIRIIRFLIYRSRKRKERLKEQEQANQLQREESLNNEILNPNRRPGDVKEQKHAYRVEYSEKGRMSGAQNRNPSRGRSSGGIFPGGKKDKKYAEGTLLKITEYSSFSKSSYMFKEGEIMRVGNQYGNTCILAGDPGESVLYFEIIPHDNNYYVKSSGAEKVLVSRRDKKVELSEYAIELREGDQISVSDKTYEVGFFRP